MVKRKTRHLRRKRISKLQLEVLKTMFLTLFGVIVVSVAGTLVIRAFLSAVTETLVNPFYSMTYTDITGATGTDASKADAKEARNALRSLMGLTLES